MSAIPNKPPTTGPATHALFFSGAGVGVLDALDVGLMAEVAVAVGEDTIVDGLLLRKVDEGGVVVAGRFR